MFSMNMEYINNSLNKEVDMWRNSDKFKVLFEEIDLYSSKENRNKFLIRFSYMRRTKIKLMKLYEEEYIDNKDLIEFLHKNENLIDELDREVKILEIKVKPICLESLNCSPLYNIRQSIFKFAKNSFFSIFSSNSNNPKENKSD